MMGFEIVFLKSISSLNLIFQVHCVQCLTKVMPPGFLENHQIFYKLKKVDQIIWSNAQWNVTMFIATGVAKGAQGGPWPPDDRRVKKRGSIGV